MPAWIDWAMKEIGQREQGNNAGPVVARYIKLARAGTIGDPWCAIFANAALEANGVAGTRSASSQSFRHSPLFYQLNTPALGALAIFWRGSIYGGLGHVGFYVGENDSRVSVLGGNEGDKVAIENYPKTTSSFGLRGYWWPKGVLAPMERGPLPLMATNAGGKVV